MEVIKVYSPVEDKDIRTNLKDSPIWAQSYNESELFDAKKKHAQLFEYLIRFDGLKPVQVNKITKL